MIEQILDTSRLPTVRNCLKSITAFIEKLKRYFILRHSNENIKNFLTNKYENELLNLYKRDKHVIVARIARYAAGCCHAYKWHLGDLTAWEVTKATKCS